ncbi:ATP-binding protein [Sideroxydans lithotrophicus]|uniref:histidine kinase n=1 Tax=Sideroxydans lithotrophicus (strain ES-1) TaxID=580332 RepID=D5CMB0_SIDLE|nr:ATP-binding protein [Sideroxydans lithotrophicus]ADE10724.1 integral membrane sensor signal transduction histidine kinase [Sideroxydans lithotrophicus ES-1]
MFAIFHSMHGRLFLILLVGMIVTSIGTVLLTHSRQQELYERVRAQHLATDITELVETLEITPLPLRDDFLHEPHGMGIHGHLSEVIVPPFAARDRVMEDALKQRLNVASIAAESPNYAACGDEFIRWSRRLHQPLQCQRIHIALPDGSGLLLVIPMPPMRDQSYPPPVWSAMLLFAVCIGLLAWVVARIATRPLRQLADAADKLDISRAGEPLPEQGSSEVRMATRAFNRMQKRIYEDVRERTGMLAAITHDLQTPLTRLRLRLEKLPDEALRNKLVGDMQAMQQMLQEGLELSRSLDSSEAMQLLDLDSLLDSLCSDAVEAGQQIYYRERTAVQLKAQPLALRRAFSNLLDNAVKYGQRAEVSLRRDARQCHVRIRDFGPGIPPELLETVFTPFYRIEHSRSRESGGTGLGLSIARNIVLRHNGELTLSNHADGGLQVHVILPL